MQFKATKENLLNDFVDNAIKIIADSTLYLKAKDVPFSKEYVDHNLIVLELSVKGAISIKNQGESSQFYDEIEEILRYNGGEVFEMSQNDVLKLCYRAGFYF